MIWTRAVPDVERFPVMEADPVPLAEGQVLRGVRHHRRRRAVDEHRLSAPSTCPTALSKAPRKKRIPLPPRRGGYNQYPILRQFGEFDTNTAYAFNNPTTVADAQQLRWMHGRVSIPARTSPASPHRLIAYQGDMKYDYRTDTYSGDPLPESKRRSWFISIRQSGGFPSSAAQRKASRGMRA